MPELRLLTVCSMNICRSPAAAELFAEAFGDEALAIEATSESAGCAGGLAVGASRCDLAQAMIGIAEPKGRARILTAEIASGADLVITADRGHRGRVAAIAPGARQRTFALLEADRLAEWVLGPDGVLELGRTKAEGGELDLEPGDVRRMVEPLPDPGPARIHWLIAEMDAARGMVPLRENPWSFLDLDDVGCDDLPDPHVLGTSLHEPVVRRMQAAVRGLVRSIGLALNA